MSYETNYEAGSAPFGIEIINEREGNLVEAYVSVGLIFGEDVPVDEDHVKELAASIEKESSLENSTGQLSPILLAQVNDFDKLVVIDGFHRAKAMEQLGKEKVFATVKLDSDWDDVTDLRIITAKSHKSVRFSRIVEWVEESWARTEWSDMVNASSAFQITFLPSSTGRRSGLSAEDTEGVRKWVRTKCEQWGVPPSHIDRYLRTARQAAPDLVKEARERKGGHKLEAITPRHLEGIVKYLPNNYELQRLTAAAAREHTLTVPQTKALSLAISKADNSEEIVEIIESRAWERLEAATKNLTKSRYKNIDPTKPEQYTAALTDKFFDEQVEIAQIMIENAILTGVYSPHLSSGNGRVTALVLEHKGEAGSASEGVDDGEAITPWDEELVLDAAHQLQDLRPWLIRHVMRKYRLPSHDAEDIMSGVAERFLTRVNDGRIDVKYAHPYKLRRLLFKFASYGAIDHFRKKHGREGQKYTEQSIYQEDENGISLSDNLVEEETGYENIDNNNLDLVKTLMPYLNERERRIVVLRGYFGLTPPEIALVIGSTENSIHTSYALLNRKVIELTDVLSQQK